MKIDNIDEVVEAGTSYECGRYTILVREEEDTIGIEDYIDTYGRPHDVKPAGLPRNDYYRVMTGRRQSIWQEYPDYLHEKKENISAFGSTADFFRARESNRARVEAYYRDEWRFSCACVVVFLEGVEVAEECIGGVESDYLIDCVTSDGLIKQALDAAAREVHRLAGIFQSVMDDNGEKR